MQWPFPCHINVHVTAPYHQIQLRESQGLEFKKWERGQMDSKGLKEDKLNIHDSWNRTGLELQVWAEKKLEGPVPHTFIVIITIHLLS